MRRFFAAYEQRLSGARSPLVAEAATREQLKAQARRVLEDVARAPLNKAKAAGLIGAGRPS